MNTQPLSYPFSRAHCKNPNNNNDIVSVHLYPLLALLLAPIPPSPNIMSVCVCRCLDLGSLYWTAR